MKEAYDGYVAKIDKNDCKIIQVSLVCFIDNNGFLSSARK